MTFSYDRGRLSAYWSPVHPDEPWVDNDETVHLWLNLRGARENGAASRLRHLLDDLNQRRLDWDDEFDLGAHATLNVPMPGDEAIGVRSATPGAAPLEYLDAFCAALTQWGWSGHLDIIQEAGRVWVPYGPEITLTSMLGFERGGQPDNPWASPWVVWQDRPEVRTRVIELALAWVNQTHGAPLTYGGAFYWQPTTQQARELLEFHLSDPTQASVEIGRLNGAPHPEWSDGLLAGTRTGRTVVLKEGHVTFTDNDPGRSLDERLSDHRALLAGTRNDSRYGFTIGTFGHGQSPKSVYGHRADLRGLDLTSTPLQRPNHGPGLPDVYYMQAFDTALLADIDLDMDLWQREDLASGLTLLTARTTRDWFVKQPASEQYDWWYLYDATPDTLLAARTSLASLLQQPLRE